MSGALVDLDSDARLRIMAARVIAQQRWPYVSTLLFSLKLVELPQEQLPAMAVDRGWRLYYSSDFVLNERPEALATIILHEALHCLHSHADRFSALKQPASLHMLWNFAGDAGINEILDEQRMPWPKAEPVRFADLVTYGARPTMTTEGVFFALLDNSPEDSPHADCGSGSGGARREYELPDGDEVNPAVRTSHQAGVRDRVAHDVIEYARNRGDVPGGLLRWAEAILQPQVSWREALASKVRRDLAMVSGRRDYVYTRPSRRQEAMRLIGSTAVLPAMRQPAPPRVAAIVDTSGSITTTELQESLGEMVGIVRAAGVSGGIAAIACDAEAHPVQHLRSRGDVEGFRATGGGGTDMGVGIAAAASLRPRPHIIVVFTDGYTPWPDEPPRGIDSTIVVTPSGSPPPPEWSTWIELPSED